MRPPDLPGGNIWTAYTWRRACCSFNEAAGFTRRKPDLDELVQARRYSRFNEAAGFTRRKLPDLPLDPLWLSGGGFNEAAGFTRRKPMTSRSSTRRS